MANKYLIHGATYCGDGTTSSEAASAGAVGAWNDINVLEGTAPAYGSLASGDVVYIRSKTSAGADITRTMTAANVSLGSSSASASAPIFWILDNGTVWSGIDGTLKYTTASASYRANILANNIIEAKTQDRLVFENTSTNPGDGTYILDCYGHVIGALLDWSAKTGVSWAGINMRSGGVLESPHVKWGRLGSNGTYLGLFSLVNGASVEFKIINPDIELTNATIGGALFWGNGSYASAITVIGGRVRGAGATTGQPLVYPSGSGTNRSWRFIGMDLPRAMDVVNPSYGMPSGSFVELIGCDAGIGGHLEMPWGWATSRTDNNPPTLAAALPDSASTPWAWRVYPRAASMTAPVLLPAMKLYTGSAAAKTITQEILVADTISPTKGDLWMTVDYTDDSTGAPKHITTRVPGGGALDASTAAWSATTWGMITLVKRKLEITTPTSIKQDTPIIVTLHSTKVSASANDIYFVDPDFGVN